MDSVVRRCIFLQCKRILPNTISAFRSPYFSRSGQDLVTKRCLSTSAVLREQKSDDEDSSKTSANKASDDHGFKVPKHRLTQIDKFYVVATGMGKKGEVPNEASHEFMEKVHSRRRIIINIIMMGLTCIFAYAVIVGGQRERKGKLEEEKAKRLAERNS